MRPRTPAQSRSRRFCRHFRTGWSKRGVVDRSWCPRQCRDTRCKPSHTLRHCCKVRRTFGGCTRACTERVTLLLHTIGMGSLLRRRTAVHSPCFVSIATVIIGRVSVSVFKLRWHLPRCFAGVAVVVVIPTVCVVNTPRGESFDRRHDLLGFLPSRAVRQKIVPKCASVRLLYEGVHRWWWLGGLLSWLLRSWLLSWLLSWLSWLPLCRHPRRQSLLMAPPRLSPWH